MKGADPRKNAVAFGAGLARRPLWILILGVTALVPALLDAQAASRAEATAACESYWQSPPPIDLWLEVRHQSEEMTNAAAENDWEGAFMAVGAARAALDRLLLPRALGTESDGGARERRLGDADGMRELLLGADAAVQSREPSALALYGGEMTERANHMLATGDLL